MKERQTHKERKKERIEKVGLGFDQRTSGISWHDFIF